MTKNKQKNGAEEKAQETSANAETHTFAHTENPCKQNWNLYCISKGSVREKMLRESIVRQQPSKTALHLLCVGHLLLVVLCVPSETPLEEMVSFCWVRDGGLCLLPLSALGPYLI